MTRRSLLGLTALVVFAGHSVAAVTQPSVSTPLSQPGVVNGTAYELVPGSNPPRYTRTWVPIASSVAPPNGKGQPTTPFSATFTSVPSGSYFMRGLADYVNDKSGAATSEGNDTAFTRP